MQGVASSSAIRKIPMFVIATPNSERVQYFEKSEILNQLFDISYIQAIMLDELTLIKYIPNQIDANYAEAIYGRKIRAPEFGCALSANIARGHASSYPGSIIVEDDARFLEPEKTYSIISKFLKTHSGKPHILSLYDGRLVNGKLNRFRIRDINRIFGTTAGAVAYALTKEAAIDLAATNIPVKYLNDWPPTKCKFFVCGNNQVKHGDFQSTISGTIDFRVRNGILRQIQVLLFLDYLRNREKVGTLRTYVRKGWIPRIRNFIGNFQFGNSNNDA